MSIRTAIVLTASSFLLGAQFTHWSVDHRTLWTKPIVPSAVNNALVYYSYLASPTAKVYRNLLSICHLIVLIGLLAKLYQPTISAVFDIAGLVLLLTAAIIQTFHVCRLIDMTGSEIESVGIRHAQSLAALHTTVSVALTGLIALQLAQSSIERSLNKGSNEGDKKLKPKPSDEKGIRMGHEPRIKKKKKKDEDRLKSSK